jgi:hypothetical protein
MGRAAKLAEAVAPTRPQAGVESQMANHVMGSACGDAGPDSYAIVGKG